MLKKERLPGAVELGEEGMVLGEEGDLDSVQMIKCWDQGA